MLYVMPTIRKTATLSVLHKNNPVNGNPATTRKQPTGRNSTISTVELDPRITEVLPDLIRPGQRVQLITPTLALIVNKPHK